LGYLGSALTEYFLTKTDHEVVGIDSGMWENFILAERFSITGNTRFAFIQEDIRDLNSPWVRGKIEKANIVLHFAGLVGAPACDKPENTSVAREINSISVKKLVQMMGPNQRIIYPNSNSGYGASPVPVDEDSLTRPLSLYSETKLEGEKYVLEHPNGVSLRLGTVFGVSPRQRMDLLVQDFVHQIARNNSIKMYEPHFIRNFLGIKDLIRAVDFFIDRPLNGIYNLNHPKANISKWTLAEMIATKLNPFCKIIMGDSSDKDQRNCSVLTNKIHNAGFRFRHSLEVGIQEVAEFISNKHEKCLQKMRNA
jgi:nucleoside-diphosphate-sugar epimerase